LDDGTGGPPVQGEILMSQSFPTNSHSATKDTNHDDVKPSPEPEIPALASCPPDPHCPADAPVRQGCRARGDRTLFLPCGPPTPAVPPRSPFPPCTAAQPRPAPPALAGG